MGRIMDVFIKVDLHFPDLNLNVASDGPSAPSILSISTIIN